MTIALDPAMGMTLRGALALLFLFAAIHKLRDRREFREAVRRYAILPRHWVAPTAGVLVGIELVTGAGLLLPMLGPSPGAAAAAVLGLYTTAVAINLYRGRRDIDCGCAGPAGRLTLSRGLVIRNLILVVVAALCALSASARALVWLDTVTIAGGILGLSLLYVAADTALANQSRWNVAANRSERLSWSTR